MPYKDPERQKAAQKEHYENNKLKYSEAFKATRIRRQQKLTKLKSNPCTDCGVSYPSYVMDFDHLDNKIATISEMLRRSSWSVIEAEIKKCELVCANCRRIRTYVRLTEKDKINIINEM